MKGNYMDKLREILKENFEGLDLDRTDLISGGYIDSLTFVNLVTVLEEELGVQIDIMEVEPEDFESLESIHSFLKRQGCDL